MRVDRPLVCAVISLGWGIGLIIGYCKGTTGLSAAYPLASSIMHLDITTTGPAALGGLVLIAVGVLLLIWSFFVAIGSIFTSRDEDETVEQMESYSVVPREQVMSRPRWVDPLDTEPEDVEPDAEQGELWSRSSARIQM